MLLPLIFCITQCSIFSPRNKKSEEDKDLQLVCQLACESKYLDVYGVAYFRRVYNESVYCRCKRRDNKDMGLYVDLEEETIEPEVETFIPP
jgi:hypothetical protein